MTSIGAHPKILKRIATTAAGKPAVEVLRFVQGMALSKDERKEVIRLVSLHRKENN